MAAPKRKMSKSRRDKRRANWKLTVPGYVLCPQCHEPKLPHHVCMECGFYDGKEVIAQGEYNQEGERAEEPALFLLAF